QFSSQVWWQLDRFCYLVKRQRDLLDRLRRSECRTWRIVVAELVHGIENVAHLDPAQLAILVEECEAPAQPGRRRRVLVRRGIAPEPFGPQAVDVAVMRVEDGIARGRVQPAHVGIGCLYLPV